MPKTKKTKPIKKNREQVAALPFRKSPSGEIEILLITSRETRRFIIPKGWRMKSKKPWQAAAIEARQEAGVKGDVSAKPFGTYTYWKRMARYFQLIDVEVYPLEVKKESSKWREKDERQRKWLTVADAALLIDEPELVSLVLEFGGGPRPKRLGAFLR